MASARGSFPTALDAIWSFGLVANLRRDDAFFVDLAVAALPDQARVGIRHEPHDARRHHPRLREYIRIFDGDLVENLIALSRELLDEVHLVGVEEAASREPGAVDERVRVDDEGVAFPAANA